MHRERPRRNQRDLGAARYTDILIFAVGSDFCDAAFRVYRAYVFLDAAATLRHVELHDGPARMPVGSLGLFLGKEFDLGFAEAGVFA